MKREDKKLDPSWKWGDAYLWLKWWEKTTYSPNDGLQVILIMADFYHYIDYIPI